MRTELAHLLQHSQEMRAQALRCADQGDFDGALRIENAIFVRLLGDSRVTAVQSFLADVMTDIAGILRDHGILSGREGAIEYYERAWREYRDLGNRSGLGAVELYLGACYEMSGYLGRAVGHYRAALQALEGVPGCEALRARAYLRHATIYTKADLHIDAERYLERTHSALERYSASPDDRSFFLQKKALLLAGQGRLDSARRSIEDASKVIGSNSWLRSVQLLVSRASIEFRDNQIPNALLAATAAKEIAATYSFRHQEAKIDRLLNECRTVLSGAESRRAVFLPDAHNDATRYATVLTRLRPLDGSLTADEFKALAAQDNFQGPIHSQALVDPNLPDAFKRSVTLVLKGGGAKGIAFLGALEVLNPHFDFVGYAGTSVGAMFAALLAAGYSVEELEAVIQETDFTLFKDGGFWRGVLWRLWRGGGIYRGEALPSWADKLLKRKLNTLGSPRLRDLPRRAVIFACGGPSGGTVRFDSRGENADAPVAFAIRASVAIPWIFRSVQHNGMTLVDGGLLRNFPYDDLMAQEPERQLLGIYLISHESHNPEESRHAGPLSLFRFLFNIILNRDELNVVDTHSNQIVVIDPFPITTTQLRLSTAERRMLVLAGRVGAHEFLQRLGMPVDLATVDEERSTLERTRLEIRDAMHRASRRRLGMLMVLLLIAILLTYVAF